MPNPRFLSQKKIFQGKKIDLTLEKFHYGKHVFTRETITHPGSVVILPRLPDGKLILIYQYRHTCRKRIWELPAGTIEVKKGRREPALYCARRELQEEGGFRAGRFRKLCDFYLAPGTSTEKMTFYLADKLTRNKLPEDADEIIETHVWTLKQTLEMIHSGRIRDAKTIAAILFYASYVVR